MYHLLGIDLECEEEVATQSDGGLAETNAGRQALGRKRMYSETIMEQVSPSSPDAKCKQASNLHNERERERWVTDWQCMYMDAFAIQSGTMHV